ncbi:MAG: Fe-S cluster assembly protein SufD [Flavobacteriales bacterium]|nr:Fe-S cluster assembly protein SufD [Flavobacteriales bacterium]
MTTTELSKKDKFLSVFSSQDYSDEENYYISLRTQAKEELKNLDFPTSKNEYWKYTRLGKISNSDFCLGKQESIDINSFLIPDLDATVLVVVNGYLDESLSSKIQQNGVTVCSLSHAKKTNQDSFSKRFNKNTASKNELFLTINNAFHSDGIFIEIDRNHIAEKPFHILNITTSNQSATISRNVFISQPNSKLKIVESFVNLNGEANFQNHVSEIFVEENAHLEYNKIQEKSNNNFSVTTEQVQQKANSNFTINTATFSGALVRNNLNVEIEAENCETHLYGLYLAKNKDHIDNHTVIDHKEPHCNSFEVYKGVLEDESTGVFNGKVFVRPNAQKTNAFQQNNNILLNDTATIYSKPELEIYADDVKCSHGSTTGQIDDVAIFYLQSRGIGKQSALKLMISAFAKDALDKISIEPLHDFINLKIEQRFE